MAAQLKTLYEKNMKKIIILISFTLFLATGINSYSQEPPPTPRESRHDQQSATTTTDSKGSYHQYRTQNAAVIPKTVVGEMANPNGGEQRQNVDQRSSQNNFIDIISIILTTLATIVIAIFTCLLYMSNKKLFIATHHPKLRVHSIYLEKLNSTPNFTNSSIPITHQINCSIDNIGKSTATIIKISMTFKRLNDPLHVPSYGEPLFIKKTIACGESITESCNIGAFVIDENIERGINDLYFFGYIDYRDSAQTTRRTAFCRRYIRETKRFIKIKDEDYEYSY